MNTYRQERSCRLTAVVRGFVVGVLITAALGCQGHPSDLRFGLSEEDRQILYLAMMGLKRAALEEASWKAQISDEVILERLVNQARTADEFGELLEQKMITRRREADARAMDTYRWQLGELARQKGLTVEQLQDIVVEGSQKGWRRF